MNIRFLVRTVLLLSILALSSSVMAQDELAATLEVLRPGVEVQRVNTVNPIAVTVEAIVGIGDVIRTDAAGSARITFFADGTDVTLEPNTEYRIARFTQSGEDFELRVELLIGQAIHRLNRVLGAGSSYDVTTPAMILAARGTVFAVRVESDGRSAILVTEGNVNAGNAETSADVPAGFGIRTPVDGALSDVVRADSFDKLDSAIDGCSASVTTVDDVRLNVRVGPNLGAPRAGTVSADEIDRFFGVSESGGWYRIIFRGSFGWILSSTADIDDVCPNLREFPDSHLEDISLYEMLGDPISADSMTIVPTAPVETATPEAPGEDD